MSQRISLEQNDDNHLRLLRAAAVFHHRAAVTDRLRWCLAFTVGAGGVLSLVFTQAVVPTLIIAVAYSVLGELAAVAGIRFINTKAALVQQSFDVSLFGLDWTLQQDRPPDQEVTRLSAQFRGTDATLRNWYVDVTGMPVGVAVVVCQRQNLHWDSDLRQEWTLRLVAGIAAYLALAFVVSLLVGWTVADMTKWWIAPALPLIVAAVSSVLLHRRSIADRRAILRSLNTALDGAGKRSDPENDLRAVSARAQDAIFVTRSNAPRVPGWFYLARKPAYAAGFAVEAQGLRAQWAAKK